MTETLAPEICSESSDQRQNLINEIAQLIIDSVNLRHVNPAEVRADTVLTKGGLELDSVDILEIVVAVEQHFGVKVKDAESGKKHFATIGSIADFILGTAR